MERKYKKRSNLVNNTGYTPGYASEQNPMNIIPNRYITMEDTPYPLYGQPMDQFGNPIADPTYMEPGMNYDYGEDADYVAEVPAYKGGGQKSDWENISQKIKTLLEENPDMPQKQAIAIAYSMWNQKHKMGGEQLPMYQVGTQVPTESIFETYSPTTNTSTTPKIEPILGQMAPIRLQGSGLSGIPTQTTPKIEGTWYENNPAGMQTNFGGPQKIETSKIQPVNLQGSTNSLGVNQTELNNIEKQLKQKPLTTDGGAKAREAAEGFGTTQFVNPYGDVGMEDALGFSGQQFAKGNTGMGIAGAALGALKGTKSFLQGMGAQKRQDQIMKGYAEDQRKYMTGEGNEVAMKRRGGYFQDGDTYRDEPTSNMSLKNPQFSEQRRKIKGKARQEEEVEPVMEVNPVFGPQNREYDDTDQVTEYSDPNEMTKEQADSFMDMYNKDQVSKNSTSARDTWEQKTGMSWSKAKELGYTDGSAKDNMKLLSELNDPRFKKENLRKAPVSRKATAPKKEEEDNTVYNAGQLKEVIIKRPAKNKDTYVDPYKGWYKDKEGDLRNEKGVMVGLDGKPLNWLERNLSTGISLPPLDEKGRRMKPLGPMPTVAESNAYNLAQSRNKLKAQEQAKRAANQKQQQQKLMNKVWSNTNNNNRPFGFFQDGGMQPEMEEEEGAMMGAPEEEQGGEEQMQQIAQQVGQMLQQGADPQEVMQQLVEMGIPEEEAQQIIQMVIEQMQGGQQQATPQLGQGSLTIIYYFQNFYGSLGLLSFVPSSFHLQADLS